MPPLTLKTHTLHYTTAGTPTRPPLLLLHGFLGNHQDFAATLPLLSQHFYCITPDLPGHGKTLTAKNAFTFSATAQAIFSLLQFLNISKVNLLGYSMGGRIALYLACYFPQWFRQVVLESASPGLKTNLERQQRRKKDKAIAQRLETMPFSDFLQQWYQNPLFSEVHKHPDLYAAMLHRRQQNRPTELARALRGLGTGEQPSLWNKLKEMPLPLLLIAGECDRKFVDINQKMVKVRSQHSTALKIFPGCDHNVHLLAPKAYEKTIVHFQLSQTSDSSKTI